MEMREQPRRSIHGLLIAFLNPQANFDCAGTGIGQHPDFGGQLIYVREISTSLARNGIDIDIVTRQFVDSRWPTFSKREEVLPTGTSGCVRILRIPCGPSTFLRKEGLWPHLGVWVRNIKEFYDGEGRWPDATTGHYADGGLACAMLQDHRRVPFATFTAHSLGAQKRDVLIKEGKGLAGFHFSDRLAAERRSMLSARRIIVSTEMERYKQYAHPLYRSAIHVQKDTAKFACIPPGVNFAIFGPGASSAGDESTVATVEKALARNVPASRHHLPIVVAAGRLDAKKNHIGMIKAFAQSPMLQRHANLLLLMKGDINTFRHPAKTLAGDELELVSAMSDIMRESGMLGTSVIVPGLQNTQSEIAAVFRHLSSSRQGVFCHVAHYEPFGLMVLEALSAGLPAVCTQNGGPSESLRSEDEDYALLVDPSNVQQIAGSLYRLVSSKEEWEEYRAKGQKRVFDRYTWDAAANRYLEVIVDAIGQKV